MEILKTKWSSEREEDRITVYDPATGKESYVLQGSGEAEVNAAIDFAYDTFKSTWKKVTCLERGKLLLKAADLLESNMEELAKLESVENGKPLYQSRGDVNDCINSFRLFGGMCTSSNLPSHVHNSGPVANVSTLEPFGVVAAICPFNWPPIHAGAKIAPALAVGNVIVIKTPDQNPAVINKICEIVNQVVPEGVVTCINGKGIAGAAMASNPKVRYLSFTGSPITGKIVSKTAADNLIPMTMELGGKNPLVVFEDADVETATRDILDAAFYNQGEACTAASRILIHESLYDEIVPRLIEAVPKLRVGHPLNEKTHVGPIISRKQQEKILEYLEIGVKEGATIAAQAPVPDEEEYKDGFWVKPTLITDVRSDMRIMQEEIFGPVTCVIPFKTYDEAIEIANSTSFGLVAGIYSSSFETCWQASQDIDAGTFFINNYNRMTLLGSPFGGCKESGYGRERYADTLREYGMVKTRKFATGVGKVAQWFAVDEVLNSK